jgi:hypothetical protein
MFLEALYEILVDCLYRLFALCAGVNHSLHLALT